MTGFVLLGLVFTASDLVGANPPGVVTYQGRVSKSGVPVQGTGQFKFALVNPAGNLTYWSNDGTSSVGEEPGVALNLIVNQGLFSIGLGDTNIANQTQAIPASLFASGERLLLRIWFTDGSSPFHRLTPDQPLTSTPYALNAQQAQSVDPASEIRLRNGAGFETAIVDGDSAGVGQVQLGNGTMFTMQLDGGLGRVIYNRGATPLITAGHDNVTHPKRMWISHSLTFDTWGMQYRDITSDGHLGDAIEFVAGDQTRPKFSFNLASGDLAVFNTAGNALFTVRGTGSVGVGINVPQEALHVVGRIRASTLAGTGFAPLAADASGNIVRTTPATVTKYYAINGNTFHSQSTSFNPGSIAHNESGSLELVAQVNLPHGATVTAVSFNFGDTSTASNLRMRLIKLDNPGLFTAATLADVTSSGSASATSTLIDSTISDALIDNSNGAYQVSITPTTAWDSNKLGIRNVLISYTE